MIGGRAIRAGRTIACLVLLAGLPSPAAADWLFAPFLGATFAGSVVLPDLEQGASSPQAVYGGSAGWWSRGILGVEADFGYSPRFFERNTVAPLVADSNVVTLGLGVVIAMPLSVTRDSLRPYVVGGLGWMHAAIEEETNVFPEIFGRAKNSIGMNVGGGAVGFITDRTGVRFEVRHFRSLERDENKLTGERVSLLGFWRATAGIVIKR